MLPDSFILSWFIRTCSFRVGITVIRSSQGSYWRLNVFFLLKRCKKGFWLMSMLKLHHTHIFFKKEKKIYYKNYSLLLEIYNYFSCQKKFWNKDVIIRKDVMGRPAFLIDFECFNSYKIMNLTWSNCWFVRGKILVNTNR